MRFSILSTLRMICSARWDLRSFMVYAKRIFISEPNDTLSARDDVDELGMTILQFKVASMNTGACSCRTRNAQDYNTLSKLISTALHTTFYQRFAAKLMYSSRQ